MPLGNRPPMTKHKPAPAPSTAFPKNVEPKGATRFGPAPRAPQATVKNRFNTDPKGRRSATKLPPKVR